jgi:hypothetical protein
MVLVSELVGRRPQRDIHRHRLPFELPPNEKVVVTYPVNLDACHDRVHATKVSPIRQRKPSHIIGRLEPRFRLASARAF